LVWRAILPARSIENPAGTAGASTIDRLSFPFSRQNNFPAKSVGIFARGE